MTCDKKFIKFFSGAPLGVTPRGLPQKEKKIGLDESYLMTPHDQKLDFWLKSYWNWSFCGSSRALGVPNGPT